MSVTPRMTAASSQQLATHGGGAKDGGLIMVHDPYGILASQFLLVPGWVVIMASHQLYESILFQ